MGGLSAVWHDVECAAYMADLDLWRELAESAHGPILDLGCGTGRVALDLASRGHDVMGVDSDPELVSALRVRARERGLQVEALPGDARSFDLGRTFNLVISPMQVVQLLGGPDGRRSMFAAVRRHLEVGGTFAAALANPFEGVPDDELGPPVPDIREYDGWVYSSTPVGIRRVKDWFLIDRHREAVSPEGDRTEEFSTIVLDTLRADQFEGEAAPHGFVPGAVRRVLPTPEYVGSDVVLLEAI
jgi:SAM-dependent methyltransferase